MDIKEKIAEAIELLLSATKILGDIIGEQSLGESEVEDWLIDSQLRERAELWSRVHNAGSIITKAKLDEIWLKQMGKKNLQGLGGYFVGKNASLAWTSDDKVILMKRASEKILEWTGKSMEEYAKKYK